MIVEAWEVVPKRSFGLIAPERDVNEVTGLVIPIMESPWFCLSLHDIERNAGLLVHLSLETLHSDQEDLFSEAVAAIAALSTTAVSMRTINYDESVRRFPEALAEGFPKKFSEILPRYSSLRVTDYQDLGSAEAAIFSAFTGLETAEKEDIDQEYLYNYLRLSAQKERSEFYGLTSSYSVLRSLLF